MKEKLFILSIILLSITVCCSKYETVDLSTPENTLKNYYDALKKNDLKHQKRTLLDSVELIKENSFNAYASRLRSYQVIQINELKKREYSYEKEGDVIVAVKETYKDNKESILFFNLRKFDKDWLIIDWVYENKAEEPIEDEKIEKQAKKFWGLSRRMAKN